jgi:hypothetical protein
VAFLYSLPSVVLKSSANAADARQRDIGNRGTRIWVMLGFSNEAQERASGKIFDQRLLTFLRISFARRVNPWDIIANPSHESRMELGLGLNR